MERLDIMPALLKEGNEEVDAHVNVLSQVFGVHFNISDCGGHVQDFLKLEPDGVSNFLNLLIDAFALTNAQRELSDFDQHVT